MYQSHQYRNDRTSLLRTDLFQSVQTVSTDTLKVRRSRCSQSLSAGPVAMSEERNGYSWWVHPSASPPPLVVGETTYLVARRRRCVVEVPCVPEGQQCEGLCKIKDCLVASSSSAGSERGEMLRTRHVKPSKLLRWTFPILDNNVVVVTHDTVDFRRLARAVPLPDDIIIDIGSSYGHCTSILAQHCKKGTRIVGLLILTWW